jgi:tRNA(Leu) C34 or U34 (ribose-2'-O)-methylase TrmL
VLNSPKYAHNVGAVVRAASCYGIRQVYFTGNRIQKELDERKRLPREERMRGYLDVELINTDYPLDCFKGAVPVAIELLPGSVSLHDFEHPENAVYVFGPEDGNLNPGFRAKCHHFVHIPSYHCLNLSAAVYTVLYDRSYKLGQDITLRESGRCDIQDGEFVLEWS